MLRCSASLSRSSSLIPATLFPLRSSAGPKLPIPMRVGTTAMMPPPTPLLAGTPTRSANSPEPSYIPQVIRLTLTYRDRAAGKNRSLETTAQFGRR